VIAFCAMGKSLLLPMMMNTLAMMGKMASPVFFGCEAKEK
jgi:hypothetical protein